MLLVAASGLGLLFFLGPMGIRSRSTSSKGRCETSVYISIMLDTYVAYSKVYMPCHATPASKLTLNMHTDTDNMNASTKKLAKA